MHDPFDDFLSTRPVEPLSHGFEQRVLAHARLVHQRPLAQSPRSLPQRLSDLFVPRMQLVYALVLTLGIALGLSLPSANTHNTIIQSYLTDDGSVL